MIYWGTKTIAVPTGETIKEQLEIKGISQKDFAYRMGMSKKHICRLLAGDVLLTPETALKLEEVLNIDAKFWLGLEADYREDLARAKAENELAKSEETEYLKKIPYDEMARCGWLPKNTKTEETILYLRKFFSVVKLTLAEGTMPAAAYSGLDGNKRDTDYPLMCWIGMAQRLSWEIQTDKIHIAGIRKILPQLREMTKETPSVFLPKLKELLAGCGIAFVMADHLKGLAIRGASFYNGGKIVLGLTMNHKDNGEFWLSLFHELAHIVLGHIKQNGTTKEDEEAAGHKITAVSTKIGTAAGKLGGKAQTDCLVSEINYKDYDAITLVGGPGALPELDNDSVHEIFRNAAADGKLIAAICISPMVLAHAGLLKGKKATVWTDAEQSNIPDFKDCVAIYKGAAVEHDGKIITANGPAAAKEYAEEILKAFAE